MPSGRYLTAQVLNCFTQCYMNVVVYSLSDDRSVSQGLCGTYDGDRTNDFTQGGLSPPTYSAEPIQFSKYFL